MVRDARTAPRYGRVRTKAIERIEHNSPWTMKNMLDLLFEISGLEKRKNFLKPMRRMAGLSGLRDRKALSKQKASCHERALVDY